MLLRAGSRWSRSFGARRSAILVVCVILCGCGSDKVPILDDDVEAVIALKKAGAAVVRVPMLGAKNMRGYDIDLSDVALDAEIWEHVIAVKDVNALTLGGPDVTDESLARLGELESIATLDLSGTRVTGAGLKHLSSIRSLYNLQLNDTQVTGAGLAHVPKHILHLHLVNLSIGDDDLQNLTHLERLSVLLLSGTNVTPRGAARFKQQRGRILIAGIKLN